MVKAIWNGEIIAEAKRDEVILLEGNVYFPPDTVRKEFLRKSSTHTTCSWKGEASYYHVVVGEEVNEDAAWYYPNPKEAANTIQGYIAFWKGVKIVWDEKDEKV
ncbi:DUF427 domain-containing protein [Thermococcus argininiproducens]|uniref:DUF427 domain-containing protein n=1 Tax=Thermococcus argininiproducens TaxID=2866384 RepID=A0A9E7MBS1_9EURY|nr:DUF427 domain-containing protein [Thermococcus argininiproducens]USH00739.1 DUF427 domain-containing protein [Thermococcus argininiproducens]